MERLKLNVYGRINYKSIQYYLNSEVLIEVTGAIIEDTSSGIINFYNKNEDRQTGKTSYFNQTLYKIRGYFYPEIENYKRILINFYSKVRYTSFKLDCFYSLSI